MLVHDYLRQQGLIYKYHLKKKQPQIQTMISNSGLEHIKEFPNFKCTGMEKPLLENALFLFSFLMYKGNRRNS